MNFDVSALFSEKSCRVIFVDKADTSTLVEDAILAAKPEYATQINAAFLPKKVGPFTIKNKKCLWEILMGARASWVNGLEFLLSQTEKIDIRAYEYRSPRALSQNQLMRASILYDILDGKESFIINDCFVRNNGEKLLNREKDSPCTISKYMKNYEESKNAPLNLVWITDMTPSTLFEKLGKDCVTSSFYSFFTVIGERVIKCDKAELIATGDAVLSVPEEYRTDDTIDEETEVWDEPAVVEKKPFILD